MMIFLCTQDVVVAMRPAATMAQWVTHSPRNIEGVGSNPRTDIYIVPQMITSSGGTLSLGPITSGR